jgi:hypothetical protein
MGDECCPKPPVSGFRIAVYRHPIGPLGREIGMSKDLLPIQDNTNKINAGIYQCISWIQTHEPTVQTRLRL